MPDRRPSDARWRDDHDHPKNEPRKHGRTRARRRPSLSNALLSATFALVAVQTLTPGDRNGSRPSTAERSPQVQASHRPTPGTQPPGIEVPLGQMLEGLAVRPESREGYARSHFKHWTKVGGNRCDTRREVLIRDAIDPPTVVPPCVLVGGAWGSQYDGLAFDDPRRLDVDHVVPLAEAWDSGASAWTAERRMRFANDLEVSWALVAVSAGSNRAKSDQDPAEWMPDFRTARCGYVRMWIQVKARWGLAVDERELAVLRTTVEGCVPITGEHVPAA